MAIKEFKDYPNTDSPLSAENINNNFTEIVNTINTGWIKSEETWVFASVDDPTGVITISGNVTTKYSLGMRIKFTNATNVIYGIITAVSYSSPNTTLTFLHEIDPTDSLALHLMVNSTITNNYYSSMKSPFGFPTNKSKWSIKYNLNYTQSNITARTAKTLATIVLPIGEWDIFVSGYVGCTTTENTRLDGRIGLSTTQDTEPLTTGMVIALYYTTTNGGIIRTNCGLTIANYVVVAKTSLYWNGFQYEPDANYTIMSNATGMASCVYL